MQTWKEHQLTSSYITFFASSNSFIRRMSDFSFSVAAVDVVYITTLAIFQPNSPLITKRLESNQTYISTSLLTFGGGSMIQSLGATLCISTTGAQSGSTFK